MQTCQGRKKFHSFQSFLNFWSHLHISFLIHTFLSLTLPLLCLWAMQLPDSLSAVVGTALLSHFQLIPHGNSWKTRAGRFSTLMEPFFRFRTIWMTSFLHFWFTGIFPEWAEDHREYGTGHEAWDVSLWSKCLFVSDKSELRFESNIIEIFVTVTAHCLWTVLLCSVIVTVWSFY